MAGGKKRKYMKFDKLRLTGFKSFVEPTDFVISPALPALWGRTAAANPISSRPCAGSWARIPTSRCAPPAWTTSSSPAPARARRATTPKSRWCSTTARRSAPAGFNDSDILEITRRIERDEGSTYRVNGREVRARDVQLLFADASSGARSPAMVRQGQIGEIIAAKPQARRRILEEAAGIGGLHSRRHEAELRLKGAEENLLRLEDVLHQIGTAGRQLAPSGAAGHPLSGAGRRNPPPRGADRADRLSRGQRRGRGGATPVRGQSARCRRAHPPQAEAARAQALAAHSLPFLRDAEAQAAAALQRLVLARETLDGEEKRAAERKIEMERRIAQARRRPRPRTRAFRGRGRDHGPPRGRGRGTCRRRRGRGRSGRRGAAALRTGGRNASRLRTGARGRRRTPSPTPRRSATPSPKRRGARNRLCCASRRSCRGSTTTSPRCATAPRTMPNCAESLAEAERLMDAAAQAEEEAIDAEIRARARPRRGKFFTRPAGRGRAQGAKARDRGRHARKTAANRRRRRLARRAGTASSSPRALRRRSARRWATTSKPRTTTARPTHWSVTQSGGDPALPAGARPLTEWVSAPPALYRRLAQIGLVSRANPGRSCASI